MECDWDNLVFVWRRRYHSSLQIFLSERVENDWSGRCCQQGAVKKHNVVAKHVTFTLGACAVVFGAVLAVELTEKAYINHTNNKQLKSLMQNLRRSFLSLSQNEPAIKILLEEDKDIITATQRLGKEVGESAGFLKKYGETQHFDLKDVTDNLSFVGKEIEKSLNDLTGNLQRYRETLKSIKKMSDEMHELEVKAKSAAEKLKKAQSQNKPVDSLKRDAEEAEATLLQFEAKYESSKRSLLKEGFLEQFQGWQDLGVKLQSIGHFGKCFAQQIPQGSLGPGDEMPIYLGAPTTKRIKEDFLAALADSRPSSRNDQHSNVPPPRKDSTSSSSTSNSNNALAGRKSSLQLPGSFSSSQPVLSTISGSTSPKILPSQPGMYQQGPLPGSITGLPPPAVEFMQSTPTTANPYPTKALPARMLEQNSSARSTDSNNSAFQYPSTISSGTYSDFYTIKTQAASSPSRHNSYKATHQNQGYEQEPISSPPAVLTCVFCSSLVMAQDLNMHIENNCQSHILGAAIN